jgi:NAD+ kinase
MKLGRIIVVYKKSLYQLYAKERGDRRLARLVREGHITTTRYMRSHEQHMRALDVVDKVLARRRIKADFVYRARPFLESEYDLILTVGGDGTFLEASHRARTRPILGVNSNPFDSVGVFCGVTTDRLDEALDGIQKGTMPLVRMSRLKVVLGGRLLDIPVLNDVLIAHANPAATVRYILRLGRKEEEQRSSGIWVAAASGATAGIAAAGGKWLPIGSRKFQYRVREMYHDGKSRPRLKGGILKPREKLQVYSKMRGGRIFVDGPHSSYLFPTGELVEVSATAPRLSVYAFDEKRRRKFRR